ncbi:ODA2, partial [Symbiodinium sp. KB8]
MDCRQVCALLCVERGARPVPAPVPHCKRLENGTCNPVPHRLATSFGVSQDAVAAFLEQDDVQAALRQLLEGTGGVSKLLIFYQSRDDITPVRRTDGEVIPGTGPPEMFLTHGDSDRLTGKGAFVMRSAPEGERLSMDVALDGKVAFGDLTPDLLAALESQLSEVFMPLLAESHAAWGQLKEGEVEAFRADVSAFAGSLGDTLRNIGGGIELEQPPPQYDLEEAAIDVVAYSAAHPDL